MEPKQWQAAQAVVEHVQAETDYYKFDEVHAPHV